MNAAARRFRIEGGPDRAVPPQVFATDAFSHQPIPAPVIQSAAPAIDAQPIIEEIRSLRALISPLQSIIENLGDNYREELRSVVSLRSDIGEIDEAIRGTKKELAAIKVGNTIGGVDIAAMELTTVVSQTEQATNDILAAGESIETMAGAIQSETTLEAAKSLATEIADKVTVIYMACNFQDLAGQRVTRVVDTLNFIESRIHRMIEAWGGLQALHELIEAEIKVKEDERDTEGAAALATGPVLAGSSNHVGQSEIDALFN